MFDRYEYLDYYDLYISKNRKGDYEIYWIDEDNRPVKAYSISKGISTDDIILVTDDCEKRINTCEGAYGCLQDQIIMINHNPTTTLSRFVESNNHNKEVEELCKNLKNKKCILAQIYVSDLVKFEQKSNKINKKVISSRR